MITVSVYKESNYLKIMVNDQGNGVQEDEFDSIFDPAQRSSTRNSNQNGYGLGLAIARWAIENHGGSIRATNKPETGLRITITIRL